MRSLRRIVVLSVAGSLAACSSMSERISGSLSEMPGIGLPAGAPERPAQQLAYPAVHDMPPPRSNAVLNSFEQQRAKDELAVARDRQQAANPVAAAAAQRKPAPSQPASPRVVPVASSQTIY
jgi:hypothetical protein